MVSNYLRPNWKSGIFSCNPINKQFLDIKKMKIFWVVATLGINVSKWVSFIDHVTGQISWRYSRCSFMMENMVIKLSCSNALMQFIFHFNFHSNWYSVNTLCKLTFCIKLQKCKCSQTFLIFPVCLQLEAKVICRSPNQERHLSECSLTWVGGIFIHLQSSYLSGRDPVFLQHWLFFNLLCPDSYNSACPLWSFT